MRSRKLSPRERRTIFVGVTTIIALITGYRVLPAWNAWRVEMQDLAAVLTAEVTHTVALYDAFPMILDSLEARVARLRQLNPAPLVTSSEQEAATMLVDRVQAAARTASVQVTAIEISIDTITSKVLPRISVTINGTSDITGLAMFLSDLEAAPVYVAIRSLSVIPRNIETPEHEIESLDLRITVDAIALHRESQDETD